MTDSQKAWDTWTDYCRKVKGWYAEDPEPWGMNPPTEQIVDAVLAKDAECRELRERLEKAEGRVHDLETVETQYIENLKSSNARLKSRAEAAERERDEICAAKDAWIKRLGEIVAQEKKDLADARGQVCRARVAYDRMKGSFFCGAYKENYVSSNSLLEMDAAFSPIGPCPHEEEAKRLREMAESMLNMSDYSERKKVIDELRRRAKEG